MPLRRREMAATESAGHLLQLRVRAIVTDQDLLDSNLLILHHMTWTEMRLLDVSGFIRG